MLREALGRRGLFKRLGVGALLAASGQENIARLSKVGVGPGAAIFPTGVAGPKLLHKFTKATDFAAWYKDYAKHRALQQSANVHEIDPDIAGFRLPLGTKVRMQRARNYTIVKARIKQDFLRRIANFGSVDEYDCGERSAATPSYPNPGGSSLG